jgi:hypothetical protein
LFVEENPDGSPIYEKLRVLRFLGELIQYESYTTEPPYRFSGCKRGFNDTYKRDLEIGTSGGILDISEFAGNSAYIDQRTSLQDEIAQEIANLYDAGFEFLYFDGSEGTNPPFDINVGLAQWRVYKRLKKAPIFCEGAAKSHFSWHMISGGNAFDAWGADEFKEMMVKHPFAEAPRMANDFTRLNFGWWIYTKGQRIDIFEYGTALAAACDCPGSFEAEIDILRNHPRMPDMLEVFRRWEFARESGFLTDEIKKDAKSTIKKLKKLGIKTKMFTGDEKETATNIANKVGIDEVRYELLPQDKYNLLEDVLNKNITINYVLQSSYDTTTSLTEANNTSIQPFEGIPVSILKDYNILS